MNIIHRKDHLILLVGDLVALLLSLFLALTIRNGELPSLSVFEMHLLPFSILFIAFLLINFIAGLYDKHTSIFKNKLPITLLNVQLVNTIVGISFFYFIPYFSIAPKTVLFLFLILSLIFMYVWRILSLFRFKTKRDYKAIMLAEGEDALELRNEINNNSRYDISFVEVIHPSENIDSITENIKKLIDEQGISMIVIDSRHSNVIKILPSLYKIATKGVLFFDVGKIYEMVFDRIPISMVSETWFIEHMSSMAPKLVYDVIKRIIDITVAVIVGLISLPFYPFVILVMKIEDRRGVVFSYQNRVGQYNKIIRIVKFRTMTIANDDAKWDKKENKVTMVGAVLRRTRIDELPQLWNVLKGDISLIGPRPEFPEPVERYSKEIPNYSIRHTIKPGLSGWAQIYGDHPHHGVDVEKTENKLSYDLYYIKHRSFLLDLRIALRTLEVLVTFVGK